MVAFRHVLLISALLGIRATLNLFRRAGRFPGSHGPWRHLSASG